MIRNPRLLLAALLVVILLGSACTPGEMPVAPPAGPPVDVETLRVGDDTRQYQVFAPDMDAPPAGWPLVIVVHGLGSNATQMRALTGFDKVAGEEGFIAVYPEGLTRAWLDAGISGAFSDNDIATHNLNFIEALIDEIDDDYELNDRRIYMTGLSNGGMFAFHAACHLSGRLAAVSLVAAASISQSYDNCDPEQPVAYIAFHGTSDTVVPYRGGEIVPGFETIGEFQSAHVAAEFWAGQNRCARRPSRQQLPDTYSGDTSVPYIESWEPCETDRAVQLITLDGSGHTWPGHPPVGQRLGTTNMDIDATKMIWDFFAENPKSHEQGRPKPEAAQPSSARDNVSAEYRESPAPNLLATRLE